ncbi:hypothetical protein KGF56_003685 [Candida oxycetoniae]|uniref:Hap4 transcription factor heteromerisation domain-containing protein n=1 Tax=Candida oxycetoniae TaxID=497107 RepID=A0AAI9SUZ2_9ASCO|nr:uncharacterized protein KGF56_003685 [Candida oxycetoniae]KAI3403528.2 hypothetical protein KGF56_003685 [Candida oxycetoniae]
MTVISQDPVSSIPSSVAGTSVFRESPAYFKIQPATTSSSTILPRVKTSKEWVLPPRPKPGRKLKESNNNTGSSNCSGAATTATTAITRPKKTKVKKKCCQNEPLDNASNLSDTTTIPQLLKNISIIDSENNLLKSNMLCLIHEYKHLKKCVLDHTTTSSTANSNVTNASNTTTTPTAELSPTANNSISSKTETNANLSDTSIPYTQVHKRSFNEILMTLEEEEKKEKNEMNKEKKNLNEAREIVEFSPYIFGSDSISSINSSALSTTMSSPLMQNNEFDEFIKIDEIDEDKGEKDNEKEDDDEEEEDDDEEENPDHARDLMTLKKCKTNNEVENPGASTKFYTNSLDFEDSDMEMEIFEDGSNHRESVDRSEGDNLSPTLELSRTTSPYMSDYDCNSLMSTLTRSTTVSSVGTVVEKFGHHHHNNHTNLQQQQQQQQQHNHHLTTAAAASTTTTTPPPPTTTNTLATTGANLCAGGFPMQATISSTSSSISASPMIHKHPPPLSLKKMGAFFDLPKYKEVDKSIESSPYKFKFDDCMEEKEDKRDEMKRHDDEYNMVTDILEEKLLNNHLHYYSDKEEEAQMPLLHQQSPSLSQQSQQQVQVPEYGCTGSFLF